MPKVDIGIVGWGSVSPLGSSREEVMQAYQDGKPLFTKDDEGTWVGALSRSDQELLHSLRQSSRLYRALDQTTLMAMYASQQAVTSCLSANETAFGVNIGASRGATGEWEQHYDTFRDSPSELSPLASPSTTLGNIASWTAHHLGSSGVVLEHSITCSTGLQAFANATVWLESGRYQRFLAGGAEAPLTPFTVAQMQALRVYSKEAGDFPCQSLHLAKAKNTMILAEGAASFCLERNPKNAIAYIRGIGYGREVLASATSIKSNGACIQVAMQQALAEAELDTVDVVIAHAPGTIKGDRAELNAIKTVFDLDRIAITSNKWQLGHALGASGSLSIEMALLMLQNQAFFPNPWMKSTPKGPVRTILVNAVGFGGQAISILLSA
ncbi:MAG: beta-ketoacyl synthase N-terminal-like domain-containing protein [Bacteroidota bacterium]